VLLLLMSGGSATSGGKGDDGLGGRAFGGKGATGRRGGWRGGYEPGPAGGKASQGGWWHGGYEPASGGGKGSKGRKGWRISDELLTELLGGATASGGTLSATDWLDAPTVATSPDERPPVQAAAASSLTKDEVKDATTQSGPSRGDSYLSFAGISKWEICVQPEPPAMGETSVERSAFVAFTKEFLRAEFTDAELASMLELG
jgi:hypothetical protein